MSNEITYTVPGDAVVAAILWGPNQSTYYVERYDGQPPRNRWRLVYPEGTYQRVRTRRDAERIASLHANDRAAWSIEITGR